jgi:DNA primase
VGRDLDGKSSKKYRNMPKMNALNTLYPVPDDLLYPERTVILVEGIPDALRLLQSGLPALANLGTSWSTARTNILRNLRVKRVILAFDGDEAGHRANDDIGKKLFALGPGVEREVWEWPKGEDPGSAPYSDIKQLRKEVLPRSAPHDIHPWLIAAPKPSIDWYFDHLNKEDY